jgi:hypothetical protein
VFINGRMACRVGDILQGGGPPSTFTVGAPTVVIGDVGFGMAKPSHTLAFAMEMRDLLKAWDLLDQKGRIDAIRRALARATPPSMPPLGVAVGTMADPKAYGYMQFKTWEIVLNGQLTVGRQDDGHENG